MAHPLLAALTAIASLAIPSAHAEPGQGDAYIGLPHDLTLDVGANEVSFFVGGLAECEEGFPSPSPLQVRLTSPEPDDGQGPAWVFEQTEWTVEWTPEGSDAYVLDKSIHVNVTGHGYGARGHAGEITLVTQAVQEDTCSAQGLTMPAKSSHAHVSIGARTTAQEGAPAGFVGLLVLLMVGAVARRR